MKWQIDGAHTSVEAAAKHMMFTTVRVRFPGATGDIELDPERPEDAKVRIEIPVASLDSGESKRDAHLRSADFFDAETHPAITFSSTHVGRARDGSYAVSGDLMIRGTVKPVVLNVTLHGITADPMRPGVQRAFVEASGRIDRREWGLVWNVPVPQGVLVSNEISLEISAALLSVAGAQLTQAA